MNTDYYKCTQCGVFSDDGAIRNKKFYCMDCASLPTKTVFSKEQLETMLNGVTMTISTLESVLINSPSNEDCKRLLQSMRQQQKRYIHLLKTKKNMP